MNFESKKWTNLDFVQDKKYFVQADGQGIGLMTNQGFYGIE